MRDPKAGQYQNMFQDEYNMVRKYLTDGVLAWSKHDYQAFTYKSDDVSLVFYPHKLRNRLAYSLRVRDQGSKNKKKALKIMAHLDDDPFYIAQHFQAKLFMTGRKK